MAVNRGFETITVAAVGIGPTQDALANKANYAVFGPLEAAQVRWRDDGTAPTASVGHLLEIGQVLTYDGPMNKIQFIRTGGVSGTLPCSYFYVGIGEARA